MAKYSTGGIGGDSNTSCELCGADDVDLQTETIAGATLEVCSDCARHGEGTGSDRSGDAADYDDDRRRRKRAARNVARLDDAQQADTDWEKGTDYEDDPLPYLIGGYGGKVEAARQDAGLQVGELAAELGVPDDDIVAIEQSRAARANVGGSVIEALEERLDIELVEE